MKPAAKTAMPLTYYLSSEERKALAESLEEVLREHWGPDRFDAYRARFTPPAWLARLPRLPDRDENGRLPSYT